MLQTVVREDADWVNAVAAFAQAKQAVDRADAAVIQTREALVALARHPEEQGAGVAAATRFWKAGAVNYKLIPERKGVNLES